MTKGITRTGFKEDLLIGQEAEGRLALLLTRGGGAVEVKKDLRAFRTGKVFVELEYRGNPSGLKTSKAEWWVYEVGEGRFIIAPITVWKAAAKKAWKDKANRKLGGDFNQSVGVLVPIHYIWEVEDLLDIPIEEDYPRSAWDPEAGES